ncbi:MAG: alpha/beta hydrolase [Brevinema sp.]
MIYGVIILGILLVILFITTQTMWWHPKPRKDILEKPYSAYHDFNLKTEGNKNLIVALHGMYAHPDSFKEFAGFIAPEGWDLYAPVLPNAALSAEDLKKQESYQWLESVRVAFHKVAVAGEGYDKIVLLGHSQGGALSMAISPAIGYLSGLALVAAPLHMLPKRYNFWRRIAFYLSGILYFILPSHGGGSVRPTNPEFAKVEDITGGEGYFHVLTLHSMELGLRHLRKNLHRIEHPLFLGYEKNDETVEFVDSFDVIKKKVRSPKIHEFVSETPKDLHPFSRKHRLFSYVPVKNQLFSELKAFLKDIS